MKWVFILLLVVNGGLLAFQWFQQREVALAPEYQDVGGKEIVLLSELGRGADNDSTDRCLLLGPLKDKKEFESLASLYSQESLALELLEKKLSMAPSYWVTYSIVSERDPEQASVNLKEKGFDNYVVASGDYKGMVSLGVFENIDLARRLKKKLSKIGYEVEINDKERFSTEIWGQLVVENTAEFKSKIKKIESRLNNSKKMREIFCKSVASENKFP